MGAQHALRAAAMYHAPAGFSPPSVAGLWSWLDASQLVGLSDGDNVTTWEDAHTSNRDATLSSGRIAAVYKTGIVSGKPVLRGNGGAMYDLPSAAALTAITGFAVFKIAHDPPPGDFTGMWNFGSSAQASHIPYSDGTIYDAFGSTVRKTVGNPTPDLSTGFHVYVVRSASASWECWLDGTSLFSTGTNTPGFATTPNVFGTAVEGGFFCEGDIAEYVFYDSALSTTDRDAVESYLGAKYGITVA